MTVRWMRTAHEGLSLILSAPTGLENVPIDVAEAVDTQINFDS